MAKITLNSALHEIRGQIDNWVYRKSGGRQIIARRPEFTGPASAGQLAVRDRFRAAAAYARTALADPVQDPLYRAAAAARGVPVFAFIMGDFLNPPEVQAIDATGYHGRIGDVIKVSALDGYSVVSVGVVIRDAAATVLEQGQAVHAGSGWNYAATVAVTAGESVTIEATARDLPGHLAVKSLPWLVT